MMKRRFLTLFLAFAFACSTVAASYGQVPGIFNPLLLRPQLSCTYVSNNQTGTDGTSASFAAQSIGTAAQDRIVVVGATFRSSGTTNTITGVTIGGNAATLINEAYGRVTSTSGAALYALLVPSGTTATIVVSVASSAARFGIGVWTINNKLSGVTAFNSATGNAADPTTTTLATPAYGCAIAIAQTNTSNTTSWTGLTKNFDLDAEGLSTLSGAYLAGPTSANASLSVQVDWSGATAGESALVAASWRN